MRNKVHLDFLCTGFQKCGTTSLFVALNKNDTIFIPEKRLAYKSFPHNNRGSRISKDLVNMMINRAVFLLWLNEKDTAKRIEIDRARIKLFDITTVEAGRDIFEDVIKRMNSMFMDDIKYVEDITGRDLHGEWY